MNYFLRSDPSNSMDTKRRVGTGSHYAANSYSATTGTHAQVRVSLGSHLKDQTRSGTVPTNVDKWKSSAKMGEKGCLLTVVRQWQKKWWNDIMRSSSLMHDVEWMARGQKGGTDRV